MFDLCVCLCVCLFVCVCVCFVWLVLYELVWSLCFIGFAGLCLMCCVLFDCVWQCLFLQVLCGLCVFVVWLCLGVLGLFAGVCLVLFHCV